MKQLKFIVPAVLLLASLAFIFACNQSDDRAVTGSTKLAAVAFDELTVPIDIVPHKPSNQVICTAANRLVAVAIMSEDGFDAMDVDHTTVVFEGATEWHVDPVTKEAIRHEIDVDEDGDLDLVFHFLFKETDLDCSSEEGCLEGETFEHVAIRGCDKINMFSRP